MPCASARRRASGEALMRSPSLSPRGRGRSRGSGGGRGGCGAGGVSPPPWPAARARALFRRLRSLSLAGWRRLSLSRRGRGAARILAFARDQRDRRADLHPVAAFGDQDLRDRALVDRLELHRRLVGLDLGEDVARFDRVAFLDQPFGQRPLLHRRGQSGHLEFGRHRRLSRRAWRPVAQSQCGGRGQVRGSNKLARLRSRRALTQHSAVPWGHATNFAPIWSSSTTARKRASRCASPPAAPPRPMAGSRCWRWSSRRTSSSGAASRRRSRKSSACASKASSARRSARSSTKSGVEAIDRRAPGRAGQSGARVYRRARGSRRAGARRGAERRSRAAGRPISPATTRASCRAR